MIFAHCGVGPLMANAILNFHFVFLTPSLITFTKLSFRVSGMFVQDARVSKFQTKCLDFSRALLMLTLTRLGYLPFLMVYLLTREAA